LGQRGIDECERPPSDKVFSAKPSVVRILSTLALKLRAKTRRRNGDKMTEPTFSLVLTAAQAHQLFRLVGIGELALTERSRACRAASFTT